MSGEKKKLPEGFALVPVEKVRVGTMLIADGAFTCLDEGERVTVGRDDDGDLFVPCTEGRHGLDGQLDADEKNYVGFWLVEGEA